jgi:hypothetical protein
MNHHERDWEDVLVRFYQKDPELIVRRQVALTGAGVADLVVEWPAYVVPLPDGDEHVPALRMVVEVKARAIEFRDLAQLFRYVGWYGQRPDPTETVGAFAGFGWAPSFRMPPGMHIGLLDFRNPWWLKVGS